MHGIDWKNKALKQLEKVDGQARKEIRTAVGGLVDWPNVSQVKKLVNHEYGFRLRVGRYRVLFDVVDTVRIIRIEEVKKRDDRTY